MAYFDKLYYYIYMGDIFSKNKRSQIMRANKPRGNKTTELKLIGIFKEYHITGWRRNFKLFGKPDFVFPRQRVVIFTDGCFWHGHDCRNTKPAGNREFWQEKIAANRARDSLVVETLTAKNWYVVRLWECELKKETLPKKLDFLLPGSEFS